MKVKSQKSAPLVSFILAYYNLPAHFLCECVESILSLSLSPDEREIIVVDDGSADTPVTALGSLADEVIYLRQRHQGLSQARNMGIQVARGEYLQFVDADDCLLPAPYEHCLDQARFNKSDLIVFSLTSTTDMSTEFKTTEPQTGSEYMRHNNIHGSACSYLFRRSILGDLRFTAGIWHEDEEFTPLLMLRAERLCVTDAKAYYYRYRPDSITTGSHVRSTLKRLNDTKDIIFRLNTLADRMPAEDRIALQRRVAQLTMDYLYNIIRQTQSRHYLARRIDELRRRGLFPLPDRDYTLKYSWFRRLMNTQAGLELLMRLVPILSRQHQVVRK